MNLKNILSGLFVAVFATVAFTANVQAQTLNDAEFDAALSWGYANDLTSFNTVGTFNPFGSLLREQGAKMLSVFAATNLCVEPDTTATSCNFADISSADYTLDEYIVLACQQGLVRGSN